MIILHSLGWLLDAGYLIRGHQGIISCTSLSSMFPYWYIFTWTFKEVINSLFFFSPDSPGNEQWCHVWSYISFFSLRSARGWTAPVSCTDHTSAHIQNKPGSQEGEAAPYISPCLQPQAVQKHQIRLSCSAQRPMPHENQTSTTSSSAADGTKLPWAHPFLLGPGQASITSVISTAGKGDPKTTEKQHLLLQPCLILCSRTKPLDTPVWPT